MSINRVVLCLAAIASICIASCENDLKDVEKVASQKTALPVDITYGVTAMYSDSAIVKAKLITPEMHAYKTANPYYEMPKGVTVIFYDENQKESARITSDFAVRREKERVVEFRRNVVATDAAGNTFKSEELIWQENLKKVISNQPVVITDKAGFPISGTGFEAPESDLSKATIYQGNGVLGIPEGKGL